METGILGALAWLAFFVSLLFAGFRMLTSVNHVDQFWRFVGLSSFVATVYLWGMSIAYVPNQSMLILTAVCTGVFLLAVSIISPGKAISISFTGNRNLGFAFVAVVMLVIVTTVASVYLGTQLFTNAYQFNRAIATIAPGDSLESLTERIAILYGEVPNDVYARQLALYELAQLRALINTQNPTEQEQQAFQQSLVRGVNAGQTATQADPTEPANWQVLGEIYITLGQAGIEGATERAREAFTRARELSPTNPVLALRMGEVEVLENNLSGARAFGEEAVRLRPRYTEAIFFLTQIDLEEGKIVEAISKTRGIISLEPDNPVRYYQLGILLASNQDVAGAATAFERAVELNPSYANARYYLALQYYNLNRVDDAISQLEIIRDFNPDNGAVNEVIEGLRNGTLPGVNAPQADTVESLEANQESSEDSISAEDLDNDLVTPVNTVPDKTSEDRETVEENSSEESDSSNESAS